MLTPRWSYQQILQKSFRNDLALHKEQLTRDVILELSDGNIQVGMRWAFFNLFFFSVLTKFGIDIKKEHYIQRFPFTNKSLAKALNPYNYLLQREGHRADKIAEAYWEMLQELYYFSYDELREYVPTIDLFDLAEIMADPKMKAITDMKKNITPDVGTDVSEKIIQEASAKIIDLLQDPNGLENKGMLPFQRLGHLNKFQVPQVMFAYGPRTDVNDNVIRYSVLGSTISGLNNGLEYTIETLSAKKSLFYNNVSVADSQYFGRKQHLIASSIKKIYYDDCGSTKYVEADVTEKNYKNYDGMYVSLDGKKFFYAILDDLERIKGKHIWMRNPMTCQHDDGVCLVCGGLIYRNLHPNSNPGMNSSTAVVSGITQMILSNKHLVKTNSIIYNLPEESKQFLYRPNGDEVRWDIDFAKHLSEFSLGVLQDDVVDLSDIQLLRSDKHVKEEKCSSITRIYLRNNKTNDIAEINMTDKKIVPFFTADMLFHIQDHLSEIERSDKIMWIPLAGTERKRIFKSVTINDNVVAYVKDCSSFLSSDIQEYTTCDSALKAFSELIYRRADVNITHISTLLKAYMITSNSNYNVPVVDDPNKVMFQTTSVILNNRHVGPKLLFQGLYDFLGRASTFLVNKTPSEFDILAIGVMDKE